MSNTIIEVNNLSKTYKIRKRSELPLIKRIFRKYECKSIEAISDISFSINEGEFVGLIGNNGAGKSTLIKLLTGVLYRTDGNLKVLGSDPFTNRVKNNMNIGAVFGQRTQLNWDLSTIDSLELLKRTIISQTLYMKIMLKCLLIFSIWGKLLNNQYGRLVLGKECNVKLWRLFYMIPSWFF